MCKLSKSDFEKILRNKLGDKNFELVSWETKLRGEVSQGFVSSVERVTICYKHENIFEKCSIFVKIQGMTHEKGMTSKFFQREEDVFNIFLNDVNQDMNDFFPACYLAENNILVLEDLSLKGFRNLEILEPCSREHCMKVADCLAKLHAASFGCEKRRLIKLNELVPDLEKELIFSKDENHVGWKRHIVGVKALRRFAEVYLPQYSKEVVGRALDFLTDVPEKLDPSTRHPNALCHSDLWNNNIMFSYGSDGSVAKACLIDFQCAAYRPPTFDLQLFMYCCTDKETRRRHFGDVRKCYYGQLRDYLRQASIDPDDIVPAEVLEGMYAETLPLALALAPQFMHFVGTPIRYLKPIIGDREKWQQYYEEDRDDFVLRVASEAVLYRNKIIEGLEDLFDYFVS